MINYEKGCPGVIVYAYEYNKRHYLGGTAITDSNGYFKIEGLPFYDRAIPYYILSFGYNNIDYYPCDDRNKIAYFGPNNNYEDVGVFYLFKRRKIIYYFIYKI